MTQSSGTVGGRSSVVVGQLLLALSLFCSSSGTAQQKPLVLKGGKLLTVSHGAIENGVLVMSAGKISAIGTVSSIKIPKDAEVIDVTGMTVYPGLIDSESYLGLTEISAEGSTNDLIETSDEIMPHMHVYDAFHAESELIPVARLNGITNAIVAPQSQDTLPGQDSFVQLDGKSSTDMLLVRDTALPLNFTGEQRRNASWEKRKFPQTRMGLAAQLPSDLETAVGLARQFNLKFGLNHISHSQPVLDYVASLKVPVIVGS